MSDRVGTHGTAAAIANSVADMMNADIAYGTMLVEIESELDRLLAAVRVERDAARAELAESEVLLRGYRLTQESLHATIRQERARADVAEARVATASATALTEAAWAIWPNSGSDEAFRFSQWLRARAVGVSDAAPNEPGPCAICGGAGTSNHVDGCATGEADYNAQPVAAPNPEDDATHGSYPVWEAIAASKRSERPVGPNPEDKQA